MRPTSFFLNPAEFKDTRLEVRRVCGNNVRRFACYLIIKCTSETDAIRHGYFTSNTLETDLGLEVLIRSCLNKRITFKNSRFLYPFRLEMVEMYDFDRERFNKIFWKALMVVDTEVSEFTQFHSNARHKRCVERIISIIKKHLGAMLDMDQAVLEG